MEALTQTIKHANFTTGLNFSVICHLNKRFFAQHPKMVQRLPKEERAYWYWFLKQQE